MENKSHALIAGIFALLLLAAALFAVHWLGGEKKEIDTYIVVTDQSVNGLNEQAQVRYRGIRVGRVSRIRIDGGDANNILITIAIDHAIRLTQGTVAKLNYQGVTGLAYLSLMESGSTGQPLLPDNKNPPHIALIPSLLDELGESGQATLDQARQLMTDLDAAFNAENRTHLTATLGNLAAVSAGMKPALENLNLTLLQMRKVLDDKNANNLSAALAEAGPLLADVRAAAGAVQRAADKLDAAIGDPASGGAAALIPRLNEAAGDFSTTVRQLNRVLDILGDSPHSLVLGAPAAPPGPGEPGFTDGKEP
ncbi:MAG: MlaD family protein [Azonexus sp.]|jgi:phospholipid/cholesterol/gamma-HCH transport system substrate-binding protein|nr:MlaD family protein [Azonexus sp.]